MSQKAKNLAERLRAFTDDVIVLSRDAPTRIGGKCLLRRSGRWGNRPPHRCRHFEAVGLAKMIINGEKLPEFTMEQLVEMANEHAGSMPVYPEEVLGVLRRNGAALVDYVAGLSDAELNRTGHLALAGGELSAQQLIEAVILKSGGEHFRT